MPIKVLGPTEITDRQGSPVASLSDRQRRLLAALSVDSGSVVSAERLVHRVWDDAELPDGGVRALHTRISRLRPHLAAVGVEIVTEGHGYSLRADGDLDACRFEELVAAGREAMAEGDRLAAASRLEEAIGLWRGGAYEDVAEMDWARGEIARLEEIRTAAIEHRFAVLLDEGRHTQIVSSVEEAVVESPWRDRLRGQLALALYRSGRQAEALRSLARYRKELADELGLEPGPEIRELEAKILAQDPELALSASPARPISGYQFHEVVGEGAFAVVWRATQPALHRQVAVKQIRAQLANRPEFIRRFEAEAQLVASLEHPYVVPLYDYWREPDGAFLVMRWLRGGTLSSRLLDGPLEPNALARLVEQVAAVLRTAHEADVIHRDVKSSNVLFDEEGNAFLGDFGIAFGGGDGDAFAEAMSTGSPAYASPEQLRREDLDARSDLYAFGVVVFEAATGRLPFDVSSQAELVRAQLEDLVPAPSAFADGVPAWVDAIVAGCCAKDRDERFADVDELLASVPRSVDDPVPGSGAADSATGQAVRASPDLHNPYKGLRAFTETEAADFRGRGLLIDRFLEVLARPGLAGRLLVAVGASGSGKSSAVRAGLIPALRRGDRAGSDRWLITTMIPGQRPFEELEAALLRIAPTPPGPLVAMMSADERGIARALRLTAPDELEVLLVIDQLEELFTLTDTDRQTRFIDGLIEALREPRSRLRVVATIRADFWDRPLGHPALASMLEQAAVTVGPMTPDGLERAIAVPARNHGVEFAPGLIARMIADTSDQPGALPLLQYTLTDLFASQRNGVIGVDAYDAVDGIDGALTKRAESIHDETDASVRAAMRRVFGELVTLGEGTPDTRRRVSVAQIGDDEESRTAVDLLGTARLLTYDYDPITREPTVEIAHEALLRAWPRLRAWIDEDRDELRAHRQLNAAATDWDSNGRDPDRLYRGSRLDEALKLASRSGGRLDAVESEFLVESRSRAHAETRRAHRRNRVLQTLLASVAVLMVVAIVAGLVAVDQRDDARAARVAAEVDRMAAEAPARASSDPRLAMLMAAEAHALADSAESLGALQRTLLATGPILGYLGDPDGRYRDVRWIDDRTIVAVHLDGIEVYDLRSGEKTFDHAIEVPENRNIRASEAGGVVAFDASPDGSLVAVGTADDDVVVIDLVTGASRTLAHQSRVYSLAFDPDGTELATGDARGTVRLWDPRSGDLERDFIAHPEELADFEGAVTELDMFNVATLSDPTVSPFSGRGVQLMMYLPDGSLITAATPVVRQWDPSTGEPLGSDVFPPGDASQFPPPSTAPFLIWSFLDDLRADPRDPRALAVAGRNYGLVVSLDDGVQRSQVWYPTDRDDTNVSIAGSTFTDAGKWVVWLSDGRIRMLDEEGTPLLTVRPALRRPTALELDPNGARLVGAADGGLVVVSLSGETLLADGIAKQVSGQLTTITDEGGTVAESGFGIGPTAFHDRSGDGWSRGELPTRIAAVSAQVPNQIGGRSLVRAFVNNADEVSLDSSEALSEAGAVLLDPETGATVFSFGVPIFHDAVSPDQRLLAAPAGLGVTVWDARTFEQVVELDDLARQPPPADRVLGGTLLRSIGFSPDGRQLVATAQDGRIAMWDTETWQSVELPDGVAPAVVAGFSPDGRFLATARSDGEVTLRNAATLEVERVLRGLGAPDATGGWFDWSADGRHLLTLVDGVPRLWELDSETQIGDAFPLDIASRPGSASGDELQLVTTQGQFSMVWNLDTDSWAPIACRAAGRNMTRAEWETFGPAGEPYRATCPQFPSGE